MLLVLLGNGFSRFYERRQVSDVTEAMKGIGQQYGLDLKQNIEPGLPAYISQFESSYFAKVAVLTIEDGIANQLLTGGGTENSQLVLQLQAPSNSDFIVTPKPSVESEVSGLMAALQEWLGDENSFQQVMEQGQTLTYKSEAASSAAGTAVSPLIAITAASTDGSQSGTILLAVSSLQPITHAASVFRGLSLYVFGAALVFVLLLAFGYAQMIANPLIRLNAFAGRLANLEFDKRIGWKRKDEIGELARTFDFLTDNLQQTLEQLQTANEKLRQDIEREKQLERMRRQFVAGVSHELKTPLSLIGGYAEGLKDNIGKGAKREKYAEVILEETGRMAAIVADMLNLSHLESGQYALKWETFDVAELLNAAADRADGLRAGKAGLHVKVNVTPAPNGETAAVADRFRIDQVLTNLVSNAVRHTPDGGIIELSASAGEKEWTVTVYNEGDSIPEEELTRIWGEFYRIDKARSRESGGTGIGLAIVREIMELHGSRCEVRNERGGVAFRFKLRLAGS
ncbi:sensor histidine kinase [Paenibacillus shunpengii]|uniref:histidine kinase n=1 Tax=Paenibacillus shunpengii TaxID=2054424 RepID=A0ABW5SM04_9BACL